MALCAMADVCGAGTIYLCKAYSGGMFWSQDHCNRHQALIERMFSVPEDLPFDQKVQLGQQALAKLGTPAVTPSTGMTGIVNTPVPGSERECDALLARIKQLDALRNEIRPAMSRDQIAAEKRLAQDRRSQLRCR